MANEITFSVGLGVTNGDLAINRRTVNKNYDQTTQGGGGPGTVIVGTTEEAIDFGDVTPGYVTLQNLDDTNFVRIRFSTGDNGIRLRANGGAAGFEVDSGVTVYAIADTADCRVQILAVNV